jgi:hypothetical protein
MLKDLQVTLPVTIVKQGRRYVAHTPALDISTAGTSVKDAQKKFGELVPLFFEELHEAGTLDDVLMELGWTKAAKKWMPPAVVNASSIGVRVPQFA